ncbi:MAG: FKBP-type peptidyl-prolyl cis-trans isomerase [Bacteroidales bacterium]
MKYLLFIVLLISSTLYSCLDDDNVRSSSQEGEEFNDFISKFEKDKGVSLTQSPDGVFYCFDTVGNLNYPVMVGDSLLVRYVLTDISSANRIDEKVNETLNFVYPGRDDNSFIKGFNYSIALSKLHSYGHFMFTSDLGYGSTGSIYLAPYSSLYFQIEIVDIYRDGISLSAQEQTADSLKTIQAIRY